MVGDISYHCIVDPRPEGGGSYFKYISAKRPGIDIFKLLIAAKTIPFVAGSKQCIADSCADTYI